MAASSVHVSGGAETYFAKKLASNEKTVRDKAVKKLRMWISTRRSVSSGLTESDMLKLWKGLFYCMWMSDKPKVQEELAETIAELLHSFQKTTAAVEYLDGFYKTICREWHGIDRLRLDKFYLLIRKFVYQSIAFIKSHSWENEVVEAFNKVLENGPLSTSNESGLVPDGVKTHVIQVYLDELLKCESSQIPHSVLLHLLQPFIRLLASSKSKVITKTVSKEIFDELLKEHQQDGCALKVNVQAVSDEFFSWASHKDIPTRNRRILYEYIDKLKIIPEENDCDSEIQLKQVNGLDGSNGTASVDSCDLISMDVVGDNECKGHIKKIKKGKKQGKNDAVEGVASICDVDLSAVNGNVKNKRKRKKETLNMDCNKVENGSKVSVADSIAIHKVNEIKVQDDKVFVQDISAESVEEDTKTEKKMKCRKRKSCGKAACKESDTLLTKDKELTKKKRQGKPGENKMCDETNGGDAVEKNGKKKRKLRNKSVVIPDSNDTVSAESENNMKDRLSKEIEVSAHEESEGFNYTSDSLDGSYLSTLPKQAQNKTSFDGNVLETTQTAKVINKEESPMQDTYNAKTTIGIGSDPGLGETDVAMPTDTTTNYVEEEVTEVAKNENIELTPDSIPLSMFLRHSLKKVKAKTEPRTKKERKNLASTSLASSSKKKKVRIELSKNTSHTTRDYRRSLKCSPVIPFNADKKPAQSSLKTPSASASKQNSANSSQSRKRPTAVDFF